MKLFKKGFALVMAMLIVSSVFTVMPLTSSAATNNNVSVSASSTKSGKCGKDVKWSYKNKVTNRKTPTNFFGGCFFILLLLWLST